MIRLLTSIFLLLILVSCAKNPVTGQRELHLISDHKEISLGEKNYLYGQQGSGGKYVLDEQLIQYVQEIGHKLAKASDRPELPYEFVVLNDSVPNAWALPGGKIAINRGLLIHLKSEAELAAVLGHEITHAAARHGAKSMERQLIVGTGLVAANVALGLSTKNDDPVSSIRNQAMMAGAGVTAALVTTKYSRNAELEADAYGMSYMVKAGYDPFAAVGLQETFIKLSNAQSSNWLQGLFASHPPSPERLKANKERAETLPKGLFVGEDRYKQKIAKLTQSTKAYDAYDEGLKAYEKGKFKEAEKWVDQSLLIEPKESLFHALKGDVLVKLKQPNGALEAYRMAILHNESYFYPYHQRGMLLKKMGRKEEAKEDLLISQKLLPTQTADQALLLLG